MPQPLYSPKHEANFETLKDKDKVVPIYGREAYGGMVVVVYSLSLLIWHSIEVSDHSHAAVSLQRNRSDTHWVGPSARLDN